VLLGLGALSIGMLAMAYQNNEQRREAFLKRLEERLQAHGLEYASATFGRAAGNRPVWNVTIRTAGGGVQSLRIQLAPGTEPYAATTCEEVVRAVVEQS